MNQAENQNNKKDITLNSAGLSLFNGDNYFYHVFKKTQKILSATYLISDFISDTDPIKHSIRDAGLALYKSAAEMSISSSPNRKNLLDKFFSHGLSLISFCQVASQAGLMSLMNSEIMSSEIRMLMNTVEDREVPHKLGRSFVINKDILQTDNLPQNSISTAPQSLSPYSSNRSEASHVSYKKTSPTSNANLSQKQQLPSQYDLGTTASVTEKDISRRQKIVDLIKMKGEVSIKDISDNFFDCSEKTIQRELITLVEEGILAKVGERRWSRYSITK